MFRGNKERQVINNNVGDNNGTDKNTNNVRQNIRTKGRFINSRQGFPSIRSSLQSCWESPRGYHCVFFLNSILLFDKSFECNTLGSNAIPVRILDVSSTSSSNSVYSRPLIFEGGGERTQVNAVFLSVTFSHCSSRSEIRTRFGYRARLLGLEWTVHSAAVPYIRFERAPYTPRSQKTGSISTTDGRLRLAYLFIEKK